MGRLLSIALVVSAVAAAVVIAAGGVDEKPEKHAVSAGATPTPPPAGVVPAGAPVAATINMRDLAFVPSTVSASPGDVIRFRNEDDVAHVVFIQPPGDASAGPVVSSKRIPPGTSFTAAIPGAGVFRLACPLHPTVMQGRIEARRRA